MTKITDKTLVTETKVEIVDNGVEEGETIGLLVETAVDALQREMTDLEVEMITGDNLTAVTGDTVHARCLHTRRQ